MKRKQKSGKLSPFEDLVRDAGLGTENIPPNVPVDPVERKKALRFLGLPASATDLQADRKILALINRRDTSRNEEYRRRFITPYERVEVETVLVDPERYRRIQEWHAHPAYKLGVPYEAVLPGGDPEETSAIDMRVYRSIDPLHEDRVTTIENQLYKGRPVTVRVRVQDSAEYRAHVRQMQKLPEKDLLLLFERAVRHGADSRFFFWSFSLGATYTKRFRQWTRRLTDVKLQKRALRAIERLSVTGPEQRRGARPGRAAKYHLSQIADDVLRDYDQLQPAFKKAWDAKPRRDGNAGWGLLRRRLTELAVSAGVPEIGASRVIQKRLADEAPPGPAPRPARIIEILLATKWRLRRSGVRPEHIAAIIKARRVRAPGNSSE